MMPSRARRTHRRAHARVLSLLTALAAIVAFAGCGSSDNGPQSDVPDNRRTEDSRPEDVSAPPPCSELFAAGVRTNASSEAVTEGAYCTTSGEKTLVRSRLLRCGDGSTVVVNSWGW